jgi:hypothetical protein
VSSWRAFTSPAQEPPSGPVYGNCLQDPGWRNILLAGDAAGRPFLGEGSLRTTALARRTGGYQALASESAGERYGKLLPIICDRFARAGRQIIFSSPSFITVDRPKLCEDLRESNGPSNGLVANFGASSWRLSARPGPEVCARVTA